MRNREVWDNFVEAIETDDEPAEKKQNRLIRKYHNASKSEKSIIDDLFITICGFSLATLIIKDIK